MSKHPDATNGRSDASTNRAALEPLVARPARYAAATEVLSFDQLLDELAAGLDRGHSAAAREEVDRGAWSGGIQPFDVEDSSCLHPRDVERLDPVLAHGWASPAGVVLLNELASYAWSRIHAKIYDGGINRIRVGRTHPVLTEGHAQRLRDSAFDRDDLVVQTLFAATTQFPQVVASWDPTKRASLNTYYFGCAAGCFWDVYKKWAKQYDAERRSWVSTEAAEDLLSTELDAETKVALGQALVELSRVADLDQRAIMERLLRGMTQVEIAAELRIQGRGVEARMRRLRAKARGLVLNGKIDRELLPSVMRASTTDDHAAAGAA